MGDNFDRVAGDQLRAFIERLERLDEEIKALNSDKAEIYAEAKGNGFDVKVMRKVIAIRRQDYNERMEQEAILGLYLAALGMAAPGFDDDGEEVGTGVATRAPAREARRDETPMSHASVQPGREEPGTTGGAASAGETATVNPGGENANSVGKADASHASLRSGGAEAARLAHNQEVAGASPAPATNPVTSPPSRPEVVTEAVGRDSSADAHAVPAAKPDYTKPAPWCADPDDCGIEASWNFTCGNCLRRKAATQAAEAVQ